MRELKDGEISLEEFRTSWQEVLGGVRHDEELEPDIDRFGLLGINWGEGKTVYPASQFDSVGRPLPGMPQILGVFEGIVETHYTIASWYVSAQDELEGDSPSGWLQDGKSIEPVILSAQNYAERLRW